MMIIASASAAASGAAPGSRAAPVAGARGVQHGHFARNKILATPHVYPPSSSSSASSSLRDRFGGNAPTTRKTAASPELYQPYRPPPATPADGEDDVEEQLRVLRESRGLWHQYAQAIPCLTRMGFPATSIEEATGISGVEQNTLVVAANVRASLLSTDADSADAAALSYFDSRFGADILYELRTLSASQRRQAARYAVEQRMEDPRDARDLARAIKDFGRRRRPGLASFSGGVPGDCLAYAYFCRAGEHRTAPERAAALEKALSVAVTDKARAQILEALAQPKTDTAADADADEAGERRRLRTLPPVVRLLEGELESSRMPVAVPVAEAVAEEIRACPCARVFGEGSFRLYRSDHGWASWVVLPAWEPLALAQAPVAVYFPDSSSGVLPWRTAPGNEPILVVVDKAGMSAENGEGRASSGSGSGFALVACPDGKVALRRWDSCSASASASVLGTAILVVRPPRPDDDDGPHSIEWD